MTIQESASAILGAHNLTGSLSQLSPGRWMFSGERSGQGAYATIDGAPDEAILGEAVQLIVAAIEGDR